MTSVVNLSTSTTESSSLVRLCRGPRPLYCPKSYDESIRSLQMQARRSASIRSVLMKTPTRTSASVGREALPSVLMEAKLPPYEFLVEEADAMEGGRAGPGEGGCERLSSSSLWASGRSATLKAACSTASQEVVKGEACSVPAVKSVPLQPSSSASSTITMPSSISAPPSIPKPARVPSKSTSTHKCVRIVSPIPSPPSTPPSQPTPVQQPPIASAPFTKVTVAEKNGVNTKKKKKGKKETLEIQPWMASAGVIGVLFLTIVLFVGAISIKNAASYE